MFQARKFKVRIWGIRFPFTIGVGAQEKLLVMFAGIGLHEPIAVQAVNKVMDWLDQIL